MMSEYPKYYIKRFAAKDFYAGSEQDSPRVWIIKSPSIVICKTCNYEFELKNIKEEAFIGNDYVKEITEAEVALIL